MKNNIDSIRDIQGTKLISTSGDSIVEVNDPVSSDVTGWPGTTINVAFSDTSADSATLTANQLYIVMSNYDCYFETVAATATANSMLIPTKMPFYFRPPTAQTIAVLRATTSNGTLKLTPISG